MAPAQGKEPLLGLVDCVSEMLFGLFMALTFVGAISVVGSHGDGQVRELFIGAFGCNIAWGLVDGVMHLVRTVTERGRSFTLVRGVRAAANAAAGRGIIEDELPAVARELMSPTEVEAMRGRLLAMDEPPARPRLYRRDYQAALLIFAIVVVTTFPVVLPFLLFQDLGIAKNVSRAVALLMLFAGGATLGRHAGYGGYRVGFMMAGLGTLVVLAINALGG